MLIFLLKIIWISIFNILPFSTMTLALPWGLDRAPRNKLISLISMGAGKAPAFPDPQKNYFYQYLRPWRRSLLNAADHFVAFFIFWALGPEIVLRTPDRKILYSRRRWDAAQTEMESIDWATDRGSARSGFGGQGRWGWLRTSQAKNGMSETQGIR